MIQNIYSLTKVSLFQAISFENSVPWELSRSLGVTCFCMRPYWRSHSLHFFFFEKVRIFFLFFGEKYLLPIYFPFTLDSPKTYTAAAHIVMLLEDSLRLS